MALKSPPEVVTRLPRSLESKAGECIFFTALRPDLRRESTLTTFGDADEWWPSVVGQRERNRVARKLVAKKGDTCCCCGGGNKWDPQACRACDGNVCYVCFGTGEMQEDVYSG